MIITRPTTTMTERLETLTGVATQHRIEEFKGQDWKHQAQVTRVYHLGTREFSQEIHFQRFPAGTVVQEMT
jgi:hypothetical protein